MNDHFSVIIVAGGAGERFGSSIAKQFLHLDGRPIFIFTIQRFIEVYPTIEVVLVVPKDDMDSVKTQLQQFDLEKVQVTSGGKTRFHSVKNGLKVLNRYTTIVGIHDAVRPLVNKKVIKDCFEFAKKNQTAIPVIPLQDSIRKVYGKSSEAVNREEYKIVQTPQCFQTEILLSAFKQQYQEDFTDDASVVERNGNEIHLIEGNAENIKITTKQDLVVIQHLLEKESLR